MTDFDDRPLLTFPQVADRLNVSVSTVRNLVYRGELTRVKVGAMRRIEAAELERYIAERRETRS